MAQWIRRLPTEQEILGSSPGRVKYFGNLMNNITLNYSEFWNSELLAKTRTDFINLVEYLWQQNQLEHSMLFNKHIGNLPIARSLLEQTSVDMVSARKIRLTSMEVLDPGS